MSWTGSSKFFGKCFGWSNKSDPLKYIWPSLEIFYCVAIIIQLSKNDAIVWFRISGVDYCIQKIHPCQGFLKPIQSVTLESLAVTSLGILNDCLFTSRPLPLELTGKILDQVLWKILLPRVWIYQLSWLLFTLQTGDMTVVNPLFSDQEVGGSDQDGNGNKSGASGQGSPVMPRHPHKE